MKDIKPLAQFTATHIGAALAGIALRETLRQQSIKDPLTGLFNRRYLEETLEREMHRAKRSNSPLSLVLPDATAAQAQQRAETIRQSLVSLTVDYQSERLPTVTASFGVAAYPADGDDWESVQRLADRALYHAKANGRDQVATAAETVEKGSQAVPH